MAMSCVVGCRNAVGVGGCTRVSRNVYSLHGIYKESRESCVSPHPSVVRCVCGVSGDFASPSFSKHSPCETRDGVLCVAVFVREESGWPTKSHTYVCSGTSNKA